MPDAYLLPIKTAALVFPLLALALFVPVAIVLYRRHGVMSNWRTLSLYGFLYYLLTAFFLTIVPLPAASVDVCVKFAGFAQPQLVPGNTFGDIWKESGHQASFGALVLHNSAVWETGLNVLLLVPLGVFLRYHFRRGFWVTAGIGLAVSLFFELTQYTGLWGIYQCPYRLADVDDLIVNTGGAMLGWWISGPLARWLPTLDTLDDQALARRPVPLGRRLLALLLDVVGVSIATGFAGLIALILDYNVLWAPVIVVLVWFVALPWLTGGTPGKWVLLLKLVGPDGGRPTPWRLLVRAAALSVPFLPIAFAALVVSEYAVRSPGMVLDALREVNARELLVIVITAALVCALLVIYGLAIRFHPRHLGIHEMLSGVRNEALPHKRARQATPVEEHAEL
jgi:glycopeptide antibiotics resistance protein/uncharacterized RDD family membrane protein YckC